VCPHGEQGDRGDGDPRGAGNDAQYGPQRCRLVVDHRGPRGGDGETAAVMILLQAVTSWAGVHGPLYKTGEIVRTVRSTNSGGVVVAC